jgi:hypothetical protein
MYDISCLPGLPFNFLSKEIARVQVHEQKKKEELIGIAGLLTIVSIVDTGLVNFLARAG